MLTHLQFLPITAIKLTVFKVIIGLIVKCLSGFLPLGTELGRMPVSL
jgi:hypothetical protein